MPTKTSGSTAVTATETDLFAVVISDSYHSCSINLSIMADGDSYVFRLYAWDDVAGVAVLELTQAVNGAGTDKMLRFNAIASSRYRITAQKVIGTNRTFNWTRWV